MTQANDICHMFCLYLYVCTPSFEDLALFVSFLEHVKVKKIVRSAKNEKKIESRAAMKYFYFKGLPSSEHKKRS